MATGVWPQASISCFTCEFGRTSCNDRFLLQEQPPCNPDWLPSSTCKEAAGEAKNTSVPVPGYAALPFFRLPMYTWPDLSSQGS